MTEFCERCRRPAPEIDSHEYVRWEAVERDDGEIVIFCAGCITREEKEAIAEDTAETAAEAERARLIEGEENPGS